MYRFALRPRWLLSHLFALFLIVTFVNLGFWQLRRLDEKRELNATVVERSAEEPTRVRDLLELEPDEWAYRAVAERGAFRAEETFLVDNRSQDGQPGSWVVTPFARIDGGDDILVIRGFLPASADLAEVDTPELWGVVGTAQDEASRRCATRLDDDGRLAGMACLDIDAAEALIGADLAPFAIQQSGSDASPLLSPVPPPELGEGPHQGYAVQWFIFATIGTIGYPLILRRVAHDTAREAEVEDEAE